MFLNMFYSNIIVFFIKFPGGNNSKNRLENFEQLSGREKTLSRFSSILINFY